jgi:hypothetical protein
MTTGPKQLNLVAEGNPALTSTYFTNPLSNLWVARMFATHPSAEERNQAPYPPGKETM